MQLSSLATVVLALGAVALIVSRQLRWRAFDPAKALRIPAVLGGLGALQLATTSGGARLSPLDALLLAAGLAVSLGVGAAMGRLTAFRTDPAVPGRLQSRTGALGASLWLVLIAGRIGLDLAAGAAGSALLTSSGTILVLIAVSRATAALIARGRAPMPVPLSA